jgi:hypothetical protein
MYSPKVVLVSTMGNLSNRDDVLLQALLDSKIELFCVVGEDAQDWEDALDWVCVGAAGDGTHHITTTAHIGESVEEAIAFAEQFSTATPGDVEVLYV